MPRPIKPRQAFELKVALRNLQPLVWRQLLVADTTSLNMLHAIIQDAMGWQSYHLYRFQVGKKVFEAPDPESEGEDARAVTLGALGLKRAQLLEYTYDFGDDWVHDITVVTVTSINPDQFYPVCTGGARACPPEDSGGPFSYADLIRILQNPEDPQYAQYADWMPEGFNPECFDLRATNRILMLAFARGAV